MDEIQQKLNLIFLKRVNIKFDDKESLKNINLLGEEISIPVRELVLIALDIEKQFNVKISENEILEGNLKTYNRIYAMIKKLIN